MATGMYTVSYHTIHAVITTTGYEICGLGMRLCYGGVEPSTNIACGHECYMQAMVHYHKDLTQLCKQLSMTIQCIYI